MTTHKRMHDVPIGSKLRLVREKWTSWGWSIAEGEEVTLLGIQGQPVQFKAEDARGRTWMFDSHDVEVVGESAATETELESSSKAVSQ